VSLTLGQLPDERYAQPVAPSTGRRKAAPRTSASRWHPRTRVAPAIGGSPLLLGTTAFTLTGRLDTEGGFRPVPFCARSNPRMPSWTALATGYALEAPSAAPANFRKSRRAPAARVDRRQVRLLTDMYASAVDFAHGQAGVLSPYCPPS